MFDRAEVAVVAVNVVAGIGFSAPLARLLGRALGAPARIRAYAALLVGMYVLECAAIVAGMLLPVFSVALAIVWGIGFGLLLRRRGCGADAWKTVFLLSVYLSGPAISFLAVPVVLLCGGRPIMTAAGGASLGIPDVVPWPCNTVLGFFAAVALGTLVLKVSCTTLCAAVLLNRRAMSRSNDQGKRT